MFAMCVDMLDVNCSPKKTIFKELTLFSSRVEKSITNFMYISAQIKAWEFTILQNCHWFIDSPLGLCPSAKKNAKYKAFDGIWDVHEEESTLEVLPPTTHVVATKIVKRKLVDKNDPTPTPPPIQLLLPILQEVL